MRHDNEVLQVSIQGKECAEKVSFEPDFDPDSVDIQCQSLLVL